MSVAHNATKIRAALDKFSRYLRDPAGYHSPSLAHEAFTIVCQSIAEMAIKIDELETEVKSLKQKAE